MKQFQFFTIEIPKQSCLAWEEEEENQFLYYLERQKNVTFYAPIVTEENIMREHGDSSLKVKPLTVNQDVIGARPI